MTLAGFPEMREAPARPGPPSGTRVLHPKTRSLPPVGRLLIEPPQAAKGTCLIPEACLLLAVRCVNKNSTKCGAGLGALTQVLELTADSPGS